MPTDANGVYSLPPGYLATDGNTIQASQHNPPLEDIASAITSRLPRNGNAAMVGPLKLADGTSSAPALTLASNTTVGIFKNAGGTMSMSGVLGSVPVGAITDFAGATAPSGWLLCFGQSILTTTYPDLFAVIGTTFGSVDGTHFNLPDYRSKVAAGKSDMGGSNNGLLTGGTVLGAALGIQSVTLDLTQTPSHFHTVNFNSGTESQGHTHTVAPGTPSQTNGTFTGPGGTGWGGTVGTATTGGESVTHTHVVNGNTDIKGSDQAHTNIQPSIIINKIIFAGVV